MSLTTEEKRHLLIEKLRRNAARRSLREYIPYVSPWAESPTFQKKITEATERVFNHEIKILIVNTAPRHGKSHVISQHSPSFYLSTHPRTKIIHSSHTLSLVEDFGQDIRNLLASPENQLLFPGVELSQSSKAKKRFRSSNGCEYFASGTGGSIVGRGAHLWLIEDPDDPEDCDNQTALEKNFLWFQKHYPRLEPNAGIILIQQRVNENDMTGRMLKMINGIPSLKKKFMHLILPAIDEQGCALWPEQWPVDALLEIKAILGSRYFDAMYQQAPHSESGDIVKRSWFRYWKNLPTFTRVIISGDLAFKEGDNTSFVAFHVYGVRGNDYYLIDRIHERMNYPNTRKAFMRLCQRHPEARIKIIEDKANGPALEADLCKTVSGIVLIPKNKDKVACMHAATPPLESGHVYFPDPTVYPWSQEVIDEMVAFPNAPNDDDADTFSQFISYVEPVRSNYLKMLGQM